MPGRESQFLEHVGAGGIGSRLPLLAARQLQVVEQDFAELLGRADIELVADDVVNLPLELADALGEILGQGLQRLGVDLDPRAFHGSNHRHQRPVDRLVDRQ